ncbi:fasciclin-like arabinogalactan protein 14 [Henckelia pumila]|uniref:fasciclin-like arabinogalactan protein 14 n=1 Tax=Henckelia pumila TaxID=405737 RepID=UPI003C6E57CC
MVILAPQFHFTSTPTNSFKHGENEEALQLFLHINMAIYFLQFSKPDISKKTFDSHKIMNVKLSLFFSFFLLFHKANAFNITLVLGQFPELSSFSSYLTKTNLAGDINARQAITVLVVDNTVLSSLEGTSPDVLKKILSVHVLLDYFDLPKLQTLANNSAVVTTLFQTTGLANGLQGFVNVTKQNADTIAFGSAIPGSKLGSNLVKPVVSHPSNLSVLQVSGIIIPQGINGTSPSPSKPPSTSPTISPTLSPTPSVSPITPPPTSTPPIAPPTSPPTPSQAPAPSNAPSSAEAPTPGSPPIPNEPPADAPTPPAPGPNSPADAPPSAGTALQHSYGLVFSIMCWAWLSLSS